MSASGDGRRQLARDAADLGHVVDSPDGRSIPILLAGILNALLSIDDTLREIHEAAS